MAPITQASDETNHQALLNKLDLHSIRKPFRKPNWKPPQRRNKNVKQILSELSRKEASVLATQNSSGCSTPLPQNPVALKTGRNGTPIHAASSLNPNVPSRNSTTIMMEKTGRTSGLSSSGMITYTNIESAPSPHPLSRRHYCDVTGLPAPYTDPKTRLRYHDMEVFALIGTMGQGTIEGYLAARGAQTVLK